MAWCQASFSARLRKSTGSVSYFRDDGVDKVEDTGLYNIPAPEDYVLRVRSAETRVCKPIRGTHDDNKRNKVQNLETP